MLESVDLFLRRSVQSDQRGGDAQDLDLRRTATEGLYALQHRVLDLGRQGVDLDVLAALHCCQRVVGPEDFVEGARQLSLDEGVLDGVVDVIRLVAVVLEEDVRFFLDDPPPDGRVDARHRAVADSDVETLAALTSADVIVGLDGAVHLGHLLPRCLQMKTVGHGARRTVERCHDTDLFRPHHGERRDQQAQHEDSEEAHGDSARDVQVAPLVAVALGSGPQEAADDGRDEREDRQDEHERHGLSSLRLGILIPDRLNELDIVARQSAQEG